MAEFWAIYDSMFGKAQEPMTRSKYEEMKEREAERSRARAMKLQGAKV